MVYPALEAHLYNMARSPPSVGPRGGQHAYSGQRLGARDRPKPHRHLENRQRVHRRAGGMVEPQGCYDKHALPAAQPSAHVHECFTIGGVEEPQPHRDDPNFVTRQPNSGIAAGIDVMRGI